MLLLLRPSYTKLKQKLNSQAELEVKGAASGKIPCKYKDNTGSDVTDLLM